jgi:hypothetical protein
MKIQSTLFSLFALLSTFTSAYAAGPMFLGQTPITNMEDRDVIHVNSCGRLGQGVSSVMIQVRGDAVRVDRLVAVFGNGQRQVLEVRQYFNPGTGSRWIGLNGGNRCLQSLRVVGQSRPDHFGKQSIVQLYGITSSRRW